MKYRHESAGMERKSFLFFVITAFFVLASSQCKKSPITPDTEALVRPIIWLNSTEVSFTAFESGPNPAGQAIKIKNSGQNTLKYEISKGSDWVSVEPPSGTSSGQMNEHTIFIDKNGLTAQDGDYTAIITVSCSEAYNNPQKVTVRLTVTKEPPPEIAVTPQTLAFAAQAGGANPAPQNISIRNSGQSTLDYTISDDAGWLELSPANGTSGGENKTHAVTIVTSGLSEGNYSATITVSDPKAVNNPQTVPVSLKVSKDLPPVIWMDKQGMSFSAIQGGSSPAPQMIDIKNSGGGTLNYAITWDSAWMTVVPQSGNSGGQTNSHSVSVDSGGLGMGTYNGTIMIAGAGASNSPQQVSITLQVTCIPTNNEIHVGCSPNSGVTGTTVNCPITIQGNVAEVSAFGLQLVFDPNMFDYVGTSKGSLTGDWSYIDGNNASGTVTIGGLSGSGNPIPTGSIGTIVVVVLRVTGGSYPNGQQSTITIQAYTDDVAGMKPEPAAATFTYQK